MTRVMGKVSFMAVALALAASTAMADRPNVLSNPNDAMAAIPGGGDGVGPRTFMGSGFEEFLLGDLAAPGPGVLGWRCFGNANANPPGTRCPTTGVTDKGNGSPQGLYLDENINHPVPTNIGVFTPKFKDFSQSTLNFDIRVNDFGGANYNVVPQAPAEGFVTTRLLFYYTGYLYVLDSFDGGVNASWEFVSTFDQLGTSWTTYQLDFDYANRVGTISAGPDKEHLTLLYTTSWLFATTMEELVLFSDNFQLGNPGPDGSGRGAGSYIDNVIAKPEPGTLSMLGAGLLLALRRRRTR